MNIVKRHNKNIILFLIIITIGVVVMLPTRYLDLYGDDWLAFYRYNFHVGKWSNGDFNYLTYFLTPYGAQDILMGVLRSNFGLEAYYYYALSFILRCSVSLSLFALLKKYLKSSMAAFTAGLFFVITSVGIETTNWVFNMPSFVALIFVSIFFFFYLSSMESKSIKHFLISGLFFYLAYITAPIRLHGFIPFILITELYQLIFTRDYKSTMKRFGIIILAFLVIRNFGQSLGVQSDMTDRIKSGSEFMINGLQNHSYGFAQNPFLTVGRVFYPQSVWNFFASTFELKRILHSVIVSGVLFAPFLFLIPTLRKSIKNVNVAYTIVVFLSIVWILIVKTIKNSIPLNQVDFLLLSQSLLGGYMLIYFVVLGIFAKNVKLRLLFFTGIIWIFTSFISAWFATPNVSYETYHRYMIIPAFGLSLLLATLYYSAKERNSRILISLILIVFFALHVKSTNLYFKNLVILRNMTVSSLIRNSLPELPSSTFDSPKIIYFEGENTLLYNTLTFGFPPYISVTRDIKDTNLIPTATSDWDEVIVAVTTGENMSAYGFVQKPIDVKNIYSYRVNAEGSLDDTSDETREILEMIVNKQ